MSDQATAPAPAIEGDFQIVPQDLALPAEEKQSLITSFSPLLARAKELLNESKGITSARLARVSRLQFRKLRGESEDLRKSIKEHHLRMGKAIDGAHNILVAAVATEEKRMEAIEKEEERREEERIEAIRQERHDQLVALGVHESIVNNAGLGRMANDAFVSLLQDSKDLHEARLKREKEEADAKLKKELEEAQERERVRAENARLLKEAQEREAAAEKERAEAAAKQKELEDRLAAERKEAEQKLAAERAEAQRKEEYEKQVNAQREKELADKAKRERDELEARHRADQAKLKKKADEEKAAREKLEADARARQEDEDKKKREQEEAAEAALLAPDKEKIMALAKAIRGIAMPTVKSKKAKDVLTKATMRIINLADFIEEKAEGLS